MTCLSGEDMHEHQETTVFGFSSNNAAANRDEVTNLSLLSLIVDYR